MSKQFAREEIQINIVSIPIRLIIKEMPKCSGTTDMFSLIKLAQLNTMIIDRSSEEN